MTVSPSAQHRRVGALALVSVVILTVGWAMRPEKSRQPPAPPPSEFDLPRLSQAAERRSIENTTAYFAGLATRLSTALVRARDRRGAGIVWKPNLVVTPRLDESPLQSATPPLEAGEAHGGGTLAGPQLPVVAISTSEVTVVLRGGRPKTPGDAVLAVWLTDTDRAFVPGLYQQQTSRRCRDAEVDEVITSITMSDSMAGGGLFDTEGHLLAMILPCGERSMAVAASSVDRLLEAAATPEGRLAGLHGLVVGGLTEAEAAHFKSSTGAIVRQVWAGYPAARAGVIPGDIIQAIGGTAVTQPTVVASVATTPNERGVMLSVRRGSGVVTLTLSRSAPLPSTPAGDGQLGLIWHAGYRIDYVVPGSPAALAGATSGDRLVRIDQLDPGGSSQIQGLLSGKGGRAVFVEFARRDRHWGALLR